MPSCVQCGLSIPEGQHVCSMCYGEPEYGRDGYLRAWLESCAEEPVFEDYVVLICANCGVEFLYPGWQFDIDIEEGEDECYCAACRVAGEGIDDA